ncbi:MAG: hypothetical protein LBG11_06915 [Bifidobacteriaceae bacterium]|nr:hypothetical protein [Bifidobacteriaceae bacterium]
MRRGIAFAAAALIAVVVSSSLAYLAGKTVSPSQRAADAEAPDRATVTAVVQEMALESSVTGRGLVEFGEGVALQPLGRAEVAVVTRVSVAPGDVVQNGTMLAEVSGEPVVALAGEFRPYRDIFLGDHGPDVAQLNRALDGMNRRSSPGDSAGSGLFEGLRVFFQELGYELPMGVAPNDGTDTGAKDSTTTTADDTGGETSESPIVLVPYLPRQWWLAVSELPAPVVACDLTVGMDAGGEAANVTISKGEPFLHVTLPTATLPDIPEGARLEFSPNGEAALQTAVGHVTPGESGDGATAKVEVTDAAGLRAGQRGSVTIILAEAPKALVVPVTAIHEGAEGGVVVVKQLDQGTLREIRVTVADQIEGLVALAGEPDLQPGDKVVLG